MARYYIASCCFTAFFSRLSLRVQHYIAGINGVDTVRCCLPDYRVKENTDRIPDAEAREAWAALPPSADLKEGDIIYSLCANCLNIVDESHPGVETRSVWELIDEDPDFVFPDYRGMEVSLQDCWRTRERKAEQDAVRSLLRKMNIKFVEIEENREKSEFCGSTLYREQPKKNPTFAPRHYVIEAQGKFLPHTEEEQIQIMKDHCARYKTEKVVCYCHYCLQGVLQGGREGIHAAALLFPEE